MQVEGILIDPFAKKVSNVVFQYEDYKSIAELIDCDIIDAITINDRGDGLFIDDEGLMKDLERQAFFRYGTYQQPLAGKGLILGSDAMGETTAKPYVKRDLVAAMTYFIGDIHATRHLIRAGSI